VDADSRSYRPFGHVGATAASGALGINDIVDTILTHLQDPISFQADWASLGAAALVNRCWRDVALPLLWRHPHQYALCFRGVASCERLTHYQSLIRELYLQNEGDAAKALRGILPLVQLPHLRLLHFDGIFIPAAVHLFHQGVDNLSCPLNAAVMDMLEVWKIYPGVASR
jgi:hypothetical protein